MTVRSLTLNRQMSLLERQRANTQSSRAMPRTPLPMSRTSSGSGSELISTELSEGRVGNICIKVIGKPNAIIVQV